jgi:hypothetical protein
VLAIYYHLAQLRTEADGEAMKSREMTTLRFPCLSMPYSLDSFTDDD